VEEHRKEDAWGLVEAALVGKEGEFVELARKVLMQARSK
jgi:hypothetical protein